METGTKKTPKEYGIKEIHRGRFGGIEWKDEFEVNLFFINDEGKHKRINNQRIDFKELGELVKLTYMNDKVNLQYICEILEKEKIPFFQRGLCHETDLLIQIIVQDKVIDYLIGEYYMEKDDSSLVYKLIKKEIK